MIEVEGKYKLLNKLTAVESVMREIQDYTENKFIVYSDSASFDSRTLASQSLVPIWEGYVEESKTKGVFETLKSHLVQLQFPVARNISLTESYRAATLKGETVSGIPTATGLQLNRPNTLELTLYPSIAGKIPVLIVPDNEDFCNLVRALCHRNEPVKIPNAMGAAMIKGINNWSRFNTLKAEWIADNPLQNWKGHFMQNILPDKSLYQDKLIILSKKPYSGISADTMGLPLKIWLDYSMTIRLEHECAHFFTLRQFGHMANNMHDELVADYMGITKVLGRFDADWFLKFVGLENYPKYRQGARLENYLGNPPISEQSFDILKIIIKNAAETVSLFNTYLGSANSEQDRVCRLTSLCSLNLVQIASDTGLQELLASYEKIKSKKGADHEK